MPSVTESHLEYFLLGPMQTLARAIGSDHVVVADDREDGRGTGYVALSAYSLAALMVMAHGDILSAKQCTLPTMRDSQRPFGRASGCD